MRREVRQVDEYSIATFLEALAEDDFEKEMIKLIAKDLTSEEMLEKILAEMRAVNK